MKAIGAFLILLTLSLPIAGVVLYKRAYYVDNFSEDVAGILHAASSNDAAKVRSMLAAGVPVDAGKADGITPLIAAAASGSDAVIDELLKHHADLEAVVANTLRGTYTVSKRSSRVANSNILLTAADGDTALLVAVRDNQASTVKKLLDAGAAVHKDPKYDSALQEAVHASALTDMIGPLLDHGFVFGKVSQTNANLLLWAIDKGDVALTNRAMKMGIDLDDVDASGHNALLQAMHRGLAGKVPEYLAMKTKNIDLCCRDLTTALHEAVKSRNNSVVKILLERGAKTDIRDGAGQTPLMVAVVGANSEAIKQLLAHHADTTIKDANGKTAVDIARARSMVDYEKMIMNGGH
jgi:hypothetical protein